MVAQATQEKYDKWKKNIDNSTLHNAHKLN